MNVFILSTELPIFVNKIPKGMRVTTYNLEQLRGLKSISSKKRVKKMQKQLEGSSDKEKTISLVRS